MLSKLILFTFLTAFSTEAFSQNLISVQSGQPESLEEVVEAVTPGTIVILGESHAMPGEPNFDQKNQVAFIKALQEKFSNVHVGMEFINYTSQEDLDLYLNGELTEDEFKTAIKWGGSPYEDYKEQILSPLLKEGWAHGLNAPRTLTSAIAKKGLSGLTPEEQSLMPPNFALGSEVYEKRFYEILGIVHGDDNDSDMIKNMFAAQCTWDDTMAWQALEKVKVNPQQVMVIVVGNFHARYNGGLQDRLMARGHNKILTIIQVASEGLNASEIKALIEPHPDYGIISDYIW